MKKYAREIGNGLGSGVNLKIMELFKKGSFKVSVG